MKLVTFEVATPLGPVERLGAVRSGKIVDLNRAAALLYKAQGKPRPQARADFFVPPCMLGLLDGGKEALQEAQTALNSLKGSPDGIVWDAAKIRLLSPFRAPAHCATSSPSRTTRRPAPSAATSRCRRSGTTSPCSTKATRAA
ncbi:MAG: hypothetical protein M0D55_05535 [Elusimicrobiota bacterium]|nr:MAG: hypothetical protein M0D55_05535 [Elusimicrobiota bacterium]